MSETIVDSSVIVKERETKTKELLSIKGHPLQLLTKENEAFRVILNNVKDILREGNADNNTLRKILAVAGHYAKKGDLLYPVLNVNYGISGPSDVMWTFDDEIRDEISKLCRMDVANESFYERAEAVIARLEEMIYMENNILFPNCAYNFSKEEWIGIYHDLKDYEECFGVEQEIWEEAEAKKIRTEPAVTDTEIVLAGGHMTAGQLEAMLNTIPLEITFVDADNINRFFNEGPKDFKRPHMAIDREVFSCHPPKVEVKVRHIIDEFRAGNLDQVPVWMEKNGKTILVKYMAVRDKEGNYLGTLELVQNMDFAKEYFGRK